MPTAAQSIREIVLNQPSAASILQRFDIDLCSQAKDSLDQVCAELQLSVDQVLEKLSDAETRLPGAAPYDPARLSVSRLIQHIVRIHHQCVRQELPRLAGMARALATKRGGRAPELKNVEALIKDLRTDMFAHIQKEERVLFPFISQMDQDSMLAYQPAHEACFRSVAQPIFLMVQEHEATGHIVAELRHITHGFEPPSWACATHTALYADLGTFQSNFKQHVHLENDVLFPRAINMEAALNQLGQA